MRQPHLRRHPDLEVFQRRVPNHRPAEDLDRHRAPLQGGQTRRRRVVQDPLRHHDRRRRLQPDHQGTREPEEIPGKRRLPARLRLLLQRGVGQVPSNAKSNRLFGNDCLKDIPLDHEIFRTIFTIKDLKLVQVRPENPACRASPTTARSSSSIPRTASTTARTPKAAAAAAATRSRTPWRSTPTSSPTRCCTK